MTKIDIVSTKALGEEQEKFLPYYLGETPEEAAETYELFSNIIKIMANAYAKNTDVLAEDYFAEAITGLARAKRDWDPTRGGCLFRTFAIMKIKNALNECCRKNSSIVNIPSYVRLAHRYILNVKTILEAYNISPEGIDRALKNCRVPSLGITSEVDFERAKKELDKLCTLAKNSGVKIEDLVDRAEYIPSDISYDEGLGQEEMADLDRRRLAAALIVSKLEDSMTKEELHVARGIMEGKTYAEIGRTHTPKRSIAWVQKKLDEMREKFNPEKEE